MMKTQSSTDISDLRKTRRLRINYEHRFSPGEVKKQLTAEDVILGRYKYIPPIKLSAERERTRIFLRSKRRQGVTSERLSTTSLPPIGNTGRLIGDTVHNDALDDSKHLMKNNDGISEIPKHPVIWINRVSPSSQTEHNARIDFDDDASDSDMVSRESSDDNNDSDRNSHKGHRNPVEEDDEDVDDGDNRCDDDALSNVSGEYKEYRERLTKERILTTPDFDTDLDLSDKSDEFTVSPHNDAMLRQVTEAVNIHSRKRKKKMSKTLRTYHLSCSKCLQTPNKSFARQCGSSSVDLRNRLISHVEVKPIAIALVNDQRTSFLDMSSNPLGPIGTGYMGQMLLENNTIVELNLSSTLPQRAGLESLAHSLTFNKTLRRLYLNDNELQASDGDVLARIIENASSLLELHLSNNNLGFGGTNSIAKALTLAKGKLKILNLCYNNIRTDSAVCLAKALAKNKTLQSLDVSWNGFGESGCKALAMSLQKNVSLRHLDLQSNRLGLKSLGPLVQGITKNKGLNSITISSNPLTTEGVKALLSAIISSKTSTQLTQLDLRGIPVDHEFLVLKDQLEQTFALRVLHEETVSLGTSDMSRMSQGTFLDNYDPVMTMFEFMKKDNLRVIDLFQFFDIRKRDKLSRSDLAAGFKTLSIPFTKHHIDVIVKTLDNDRDGFLSLDEMVKGYNKNDKTVKSRRIKASLNKSTDQGLETLWAYLKMLISKRKEDNAKKNAISSQARRNNFLAETNSGARPTSAATASPRGGEESRKTSVTQKIQRKKQSVVSLPSS